MAKLGSEVVMNMSLLLFALRYVFYSQLTSPWSTLYLEFVFGWIVALCLPSIITFANRESPPGTETTMTALAYAVYDSGAIQMLLNMS